MPSMGKFLISSGIWNDTPICLPWIGVLILMGVCGSGFTYVVYLVVMALILLSTWNSGFDIDGCLK